MIQENLGLTAEHQNPNNVSSEPIGYEPTDEEKKALKLTDRLFEKAKRSRSAYDQKWLDNYRMFRGKQWKDARPSFRHSEVVNLIFRSIQSTVPILTDIMPKPEFIPTEPSDFELAQILNDVLASDWDSNNWSHQLTESIYDAHLYGAGFGYLGWDEDALDYMGGICFESKDPFHQYPDPVATDVNTKANYYIEAEPQDIDQLKKDYPDKARFIKPDIIDLGKEEKQITDLIKFKSPTDNRTVLEGSAAFDLSTKNQALKVTTYILDSEVVEEQIDGKDDEGKPVAKFIQKLKYPKGRKIVTCHGIVLEDGPIEYDDKKFPYLRLLNYVLPREFWGISEVEQLEGPQKIFNKLISFALDVLTLMGNPIWVVETGSGVDTDNLFNRPGLVVEKNPGTEVRREEGVQLQPYVLQLIDRFKLWFDDISGSNDVSRGVKPEGVTAASAIEALQNASNTRLRQKTRNIDMFMQNFGQMYLSRVFQYYTVPRVFRITNDQNATKYFKMHVDQQQDENGEQMRVVKVREFQQTLDGRSVYGDEKVYDARRRFDVKISTGSNLPFEKARVSQESFNLFDRGVIDAEELLKNLRYPNSEQLLKRMAEKAAQQAQAEAQQPQQKK